jgi:uncharacterized protein YigE (DUF2233 family)
MWWVSVALGEPLGPGVEHAVAEHQGQRFRVVTVDLRQAELTLVGPSPSLDALAPGWLAATNAGLYHTPAKPVGLFVVDGVQHAPLERSGKQREGEGNFWLLPNGVFTVDGGGARVVDSVGYQPQGAVKLATQSGPALLLKGALHPRLLRDSTSLAVRNAVCVSDAQTVHLVLSLEPVNFWTLASAMHESLRCTDALYLDGNISGMWGPALPPAPRIYDYSGLLVVRPKDR